MVEREPGPPCGGVSQGQVWVALLYSVVLTLSRRVEMAALRAVAESIGLTDVRTLVATGNLVFRGEGPAETLERRLEAAFEARFGKHVVIVVRSADAWRRLLAACPFAAEGEAAPRTVHVRVMRTPFTAEAMARLEAMRKGAERLAVVEGDLWLHMPEGFGTSRLALAAGGPKMGTGTFRNWNTARRLGAMLDE